MRILAAALLVLAPLASGYHAALNACLAAIPPSPPMDPTAFAMGLCVGLVACLSALSFGERL